MEAILDSVDEEVPELWDGWIGTLESCILDIDIFAFKRNNILLILWNETGNLTSSKHGVDSFKEGL